MRNEKTLIAPNREPSELRRQLARQDRAEGARQISRRDLTEFPVGGMRGWLHDGLSFDGWAQIGQTLQKQTQHLAWAWGDWWRFGEPRYGERNKLVTAPDWRGPSLKVLENYASVARAFEQTSRRRETLSFTHHAEVAGLKPAAADRLLKRAEKAGWSTRPLREEVVKLKPKPVNPKPVVLALPKPQAEPSEQQLDRIEAVVEAYRALSLEDRAECFRRIELLPR